MDIEDIIRVAGGTTELGKAAGVDRTTVNWWLRVGKIPPERAVKISDHFGIPLHEIRPDLWRVPEDAA
jgi:DNA-binding transcriptional regulator YdaS (Cro superfamily)